MINYLYQANTTTNTIINTTTSINNNIHTCLLKKCKYIIKIKSSRFVSQSFIRLNNLMNFAAMSDYIHKGNL